MLGSGSVLLAPVSLRSEESLSRSLSVQEIVWVTRCLTALFGTSQLAASLFGTVLVVVEVTCLASWLTSGSEAVSELAEMKRSRDALV